MVQHIYSSMPTDECVRYNQLGHSLLICILKQFWLFLLLMYTQLHGPPAGRNYIELCEKQVQSVLEKDTNKCNAM